MKTLVVLVSGAGTTLAAIAEACQKEIIKAKIDAVITNKVKVGASEVAKRYGIVPYVIIPRQWGEKMDQDAYGSYQNHSKAILDWARFSRPDLVVCAGYTARLDVTPGWEGRIINIHPSLLPKYGGKGMYGHHVHQAVLDGKEEWSGCTAHVVDNEYDHGTVIAQARVPVLPDDTAATLAARVQATEREMYPEVIQSYLEGKWVASWDKNWSRG